MWHEQAIIERSWYVISIVAYYHSVKLCRLAARDLRSQRDFSDSVTRVIDSTRFTIFDDSDSTRVWLRKWQHDSCHIFHRMTRLGSHSMTQNSSQSHFYNVFESLLDQSHRVTCHCLNQGFPTILWLCTTSAFWLMSKHLFSISKFEYVPLQHYERWTCTPKFFMTIYFSMFNHSFISK